jgi:hypothetical protein
MQTGIATLMIAVWGCLVGISTADDRPDFLSLLGQLEHAKTSWERGFDQMPHGSDSVGKRVVQLLGSAETWGPYGTPALRQAVIARWRKRWAKEGEAMLHGLRLAKASAGRVALEAGDIRFARDVSTMRSQFLLSNGKLFELAGMDGSFPPSGFMLGDQSGVCGPDRSRRSMPFRLTCENRENPRNG